MGSRWKQGLFKVVAKWKVDDVKPMVVQPAYSGSGSRRKQIEPFKEIRASAVLVSYGYSRRVYER